MESDRSYNLRKAPKATEKGKEMQGSKHASTDIHTSSGVGTGDYVTFVEVQDDDITINTNMTIDDVNKDNVDEQHTIDMVETQINDDTLNQTTPQTQVGLLQQEVRTEPGSEPLQPTDINKLLEFMMTMKQDMKLDILEMKQGQENMKLEMKQGQENMKLEIKAGQESMEDKIEKGQESMKQIQQAMKLEILEMKEGQADLKQNVREVMRDVEKSFKHEIEELKKYTQGEVRVIETKLDEQKGELDKKIDLKIQETNDKIGEIVHHTRRFGEENKQLGIQIMEVRTEINKEIRDTSDRITEKVDTLERVNLDEIKILKDDVQRLTLNATLQKTTTLQQPNIYVTCGNNTNDNQAPKFNGRTINPLEYINNLKRYWNRQYEKRQHEGKDGTALIDTIDFTMEGNAAKWWQTIRDDIHDFSEFEERFVEKYWNQEVQRGIKHRLDIEFYRTGGPLNRAEYFTERVIMMRNLTPRPTEGEIVKRLSEHFEEGIKNARKVQNIVTIRDMENLLNEEDIDERNQQFRLRDLNTYARDNQRFSYENQGQRNYRPYENRNRNLNQNENTYRKGTYDNNRSYQPNYQRNNANYTRHDGTYNYGRPNQNWNDTRNTEKTRYNTHDQNFVRFERRGTDRRHTPYDREEHRTNQYRKTPEQINTINAIHVQGAAEVEPRPSTSYDLN